MKMNTTRTYT